jgi:phosphate transport system substrate-binding protein
MFSPSRPRTSRTVRFGLTFGTLAFGAAGLAAPALAQSATLDTNLTVAGAGSSFMSNFVEQCKADVKKGLNVNITYQPSGSGAGRSGFISGTTDFAGSDVPFSSAELGRAKPFVYIPLTIGGVAIVYKVPGVTDLKLSGPVLAQIFTGGINKWNDKEIERLNPGVTLPGETIRVIVRSDSSGTSAVFSDYLDVAGGGKWTQGVTQTFPVPAGTGIAQRGSDGVTNYVAGAQGNFAITYAETSFAEERKLSVASVVNTSGAAVKPTAANITAAIGEAKLNDDGTLFLLYNSPKKDVYPISTAAYFIAPQQMDTKKGDVLRAFLTYALGPCQAKAAGLGYAPLPQNLVSSGLANVAKINPGSAPSPTLPGAAPAPTPAAATATTVAPATTAVKAVKAASPTTKKPAPKKKSAPTTKKKARS